MKKRIFLNIKEMNFKSNGSHATFDKNELFEVIDINTYVEVKHLKSNVIFTLNTTVFISEFREILNDNDSKEYREVLKTYYKTNCAPNIEGFPDYHITRDGVVINIEKGKTLKPSVYKKYGYVRASLSNKQNKDTKQRYIQELVASAYHPTYRRGIDKISFRDNNSLNCHIDNLFVSDDWKEIQRNGRKWSRPTIEQDNTKV